MEHTHPSAALESRAEALGTYHSNVFQAKTDGLRFSVKKPFRLRILIYLDLVIDPSLGRNVDGLTQD